MNLEKFILTILTTVTLVSCTSDSESDLIINNPIEKVTYNETIKIIVTENCISCHSQPPQNGATVPLLTYNNLKDAVLNQGLIDRISSFDVGFGMPYGGPRLPQLKINQIIKWRNDNFPE